MNRQSRYIHKESGAIHKHVLCPVENIGEEEDGISDIQLQRAPKCFQNIVASMHTFVSPVEIAYDGVVMQLSTHLFGEIFDSTVWDSHNV